MSAVEHVCTLLWNSQNHNSTKFLGRKALKELLLSYGYWKIIPIVEIQQRELIKTNSMSLSGDHTYKFVKNLKVTEKKSKKKVIIIILLT